MGRGAEAEREARYSGGEPQIVLEESQSWPAPAEALAKGPPPTSSPA